MLLPLIGLNIYSYSIGNSVSRNEIEKSAQTNLALLIHQLDATTEQLSTFALTLNRDSSVRTFINSTYFQNPYDKYFIVSNLEEKLKLFSSSMNWNNAFTVYAPRLKEKVSNSGSGPFEAGTIDSRLESDWTLHPADSNYGNDSYFLRHFSEPSISPGNPVASYHVITEVSFASSNLVKMLDQFKNGDNINDPLLYRTGFQPITNASPDQTLTNILLSEIHNRNLEASGSMSLQMKGNKYLVNYERSDTLGWYLIDYVPLDEILAPIKKSSQIFFASVGILVLIGFSLSFMIYKNVQAPILKLVNAVRSMMRGDYSTQIRYRPNNEFHFLIQQFNAMAKQIKALIEQEYASKIRLQEATLKQLQSQIDPHFLYNSLNFIRNSVKMGDEDAAVSMSLNLGAYYRNATRLEKPNTPLSEEIALIRNYLEIHKLRKHGMSYETDMPERMERLEIPRLLIQPVVENAIVHGIDHFTKPGLIRIRGEEGEDQFRICIEDNGPGMPKQQIEALNRKISRANNDEQLCGLWNVAQRLKLQHGGHAGVLCEHSELGGLKVTLHWPK